MPHSARSVSSNGVSSNVSIVIGCGELVASGVYPMYGDVCVCELTRLGGFTCIEKGRGVFYRVA